MEERFSINALVLPLNVPLPESLARYEADYAEGHSVREIATMLLAHFDGDVERAAGFVVEHAADLPVELWRGYDPFPELYGAFDERLDEILDEVFDTDELVEVQNRRRAALQALVARTACDALAAAIGGGGRTLSR